MRVANLLVLVPMVLSSACISGGSGSSVPACERSMPAGFPISSEGLTTGATAPDIAMVDMNGNPVCTRDYAGRVVMINMAAGWCPPCQDETPDIQATYAEFESQGFIVLMAMLDDYTANGTITSETFFEEWKAEYGITFPLIVDEGGNVYDTYVPSTDPNYGAIPMTVFLDKDQVIRYRQTGSMSLSTMRTRVENLLADPPQLEY